MAPEQTPNFCGLENPSVWGLRPLSCDPNHLAAYISCVSLGQEVCHTKDTFWVDITSLQNSWRGSHLLFPPIYLWANWSRFWLLGFSVGSQIRNFASLMASCCTEPSNFTFNMQRFVSCFLKTLLSVYEVSILPYTNFCIQLYNCLLQAIVHRRTDRYTELLNTILIQKCLFSIHSLAGRHAGCT